MLQTAVATMAHNTAATTNVGAAHMVSGTTCRYGNVRRVALSIPTKTVDSFHARFLSEYDDSEWLRNFMTATLHLKHTDKKTW